MSTPRPAAPLVPVAFMSYAHHDDGEGGLTKFRNRLVVELRSQTGKDVVIFMDNDAIKLGERWRRRLAEGLAESTFLLPIITPSFLTSPYCRDELETFCGHERALDRDDLVLPVYYIDCEDFRTPAADDPAAATLAAVLERQYFDWRELRALTASNQRVKQARTRLAGGIRVAMARVTSPPEPSSAAIVAQEQSRRAGARIGTASGPDARPPDDRTSPTRTPIDALPECCVRIDVNGQHAGSGFFAAPGVVVTCNHVLRLGDLSSEEAGARISIISAWDDVTYDVLDARDCNEEDDLALLRVEATGHPFVLLDTGFRARDTFATFSFTDEAPQGAALTLSSEGWLAADRTLKLADGQVRRGMSGSPVLNLRTGAVCGILKRAGSPGRDRDPSAVLEGQVVSVRRLFDLSPTLSSANFRLHTTHREPWFRLLGAEHQRQLLIQRTGDTAYLPDCLLVVSVDQRDHEWRVSAVVHERDGTQWQPGPTLGPITVDLNNVRALVARVFRGWAARDAAKQGRVGTADQIRLLGLILSSALLTGEIGDRFHELVAGSDIGWIEVALHFAEIDDDDFKEFVQLPWEFLYVAPRNSHGEVYLARDPKLAFVRALDRAIKTPDPSAGKLAVLVVAVLPEEPAQAAEVRMIASALTALASQHSGSLDVDVLESPDPDGLSRAAAARTYDVVHYIGFGRFVAEEDTIALASGPAGRVDFHNARDLADCLEGTTMAQLVVLQLCRGGEMVPADVASFSPTLLMNAGCRAVVAYQYPIPFELTLLFNHALYSALAEGTPLEMAAQGARKAAWSSDLDGRAFLSPAVFVRNPGGLRLAPEVAPRSRVGTFSGHG